MVALGCLTLVGCGAAGSGSSTSVIEGAGDEPGQAANWDLAFEPDPSASELHLLVQEQACASGRSAEGRIDVRVVTTDDTIGLNVRVRPLGGDQECPGNPNTPFVLALPEPVGQRRIVPSQSPLDDGFAARDAVVTVDEPVTIVEPASDTGAGAPTWVEPRCDVDGDVPDAEEYLPPFDTAAEYRTEAMVVGAAVEHDGLPTGGWHVLRFGSPGIGDASWWTQYLDGIAVTQVRVDRGLLGWTGHSAVCAGLPADWSPDPEPGDLDRFEDRRSAPRLDIDTWFDVVDGLSRSGDHWTFDDPSGRCPAWAAVQSVAIEHGATVTFGSWSGAWPDVVEPGGGDVPREVAMGVAADGRGVLLTTDGDRLVPGEIGADLVWDGPSNLQPCLLDEPLAYSARRDTVTAGGRYRQPPEVSRRAGRRNRAWRSCTSPSP